TSFKLRARLKGHERTPQSVAISPDGKFAVSAGDKALRVWSIAEAREVRTIQVVPAQAKRGLTAQVRFFPDGKRLATLNSVHFTEKRIRFFHFDDGKEIAHALPDLNWCALALSPDGSKCAASPHEGVQVWDLRRAEKLHEFKRELGIGLDVAFSPDGAFL